MKILGLITARGGSKGIPGKNIKKLGGEPLISYVLKDALNCKLIDSVVVSTDCQEIAEVALQYGAEVPFIRPSELAADTTPSIDVVRHSLLTLEEAGKEYDAVCLLQPTSPFKPRGFISNCIKKFMLSKADSLISVLEIPHEYNPHWTFEMSSDGSLSISTGEEEIVPRRQDLPKAYHRDGSVYISSKRLILEESKLIGGKILGVASDPRYYANLDTPNDWINAEDLIKNMSLCAE